VSSRPQKSRPDDRIWGGLIDDWNSGGRGRLLPTVIVATNLVSFQAILSFGAEQSAILDAASPPSPRRQAIPSSPSPTARVFGPPQLGSGIAARLDQCLYLWLVAIRMFRSGRRGQYPAGSQPAPFLAATMQRNQRVLQRILCCGRSREDSEHDMTRRTLRTRHSRGQRLYGPSCCAFWPSSRGGKIRLLTPIASRQPLAGDLSPSGRARSAGPRQDRRADWSGRFVFWSACPHCTTPGVIASLPPALKIVDLSRFSPRRSRELAPGCMALRAPALQEEAVMA